LRGIVVALGDVTAHIRREQSWFLNATTDSLTALPNRDAFLDRLSQALRSGVYGTVGYVDLDGFKRVNDEFGHQAGDLVLKTVASRLAASLPPTANLGRLGGDEFAFFLTGQSPDQAAHRLHQLLRDISVPVDAEGLRSISPTVSIGVSALHGQSPDDSLRDCDMALYAAKARGRNQVVVFCDDVRRVIDRRRELALAMLDLSSRNQALHAEARTDALTGLLNRRALAELEHRVSGDPECPWAQVAALFVDIDHFGRFNKHYGDSAGDAALRAVAQALGKAARATDLVFRKGGEEFVVVLPEADDTTARAVAERIRRAVAALRIEHADSDTADVLTVTVGAEVGKIGDTLSISMNTAGDRAMRAKLQGRRNAVHCEQVQEQ
jgi:diguanylate cyclase (GGDEF)-like protein